MPEKQNTPSDTSKYKPKNIPIDVIIDLIENKGLSQTDTAKLLGCHSSNISKQIAKYDLKPGYLEKFRKNRADLLSFYQREILKNITPAKLQKASAYQLTGMFSVMHNQERLERDQSTVNIAHADMVKAKEAAEKRIESFIEKYGLTDQKLKKLGLK